MPSQLQTTFTWSDNAVCLATYKVLEGDDKMDDFEDVDFPFKKAGTLKVKRLRSWPGLAAPAAVRRTLAVRNARTFLALIAKHFLAAKDDPRTRTATVIKAMADVFESGDKTLTDIAATLNQHVNPFPA